MLKRLVCRGSSLGFVLTASTLLAACGGGTTGTSPTSQLLLRGAVSDINAQPVTSAPMTVRDSEGAVELAQSETNDRGEFEMVLPSDISQFDVELGQRPAVVLTRSFEGPAQMAVQLTTPVHGRLTAATVLEGKLAAVQSCRGVSIEGNEVQIAGGDIGAECSVQLSVRLQTDPLGAVTQARGRVVSLCSEGEFREFAASLNPATAELEFNLAQASAGGCRPSSLKINSARSERLALVFNVRSE